MEKITALEKRKTYLPKASLFVYCLIVFCCFFFLGVASGKLITKIRKDIVISEQKKQEEIAKKRIIEMVQSRLMNKNPKQND